MAYEHYTTHFSIAFGSCNRQNLPQDFWKIIAATKPNVWFGIGDNIYADTNNKSIFQDKYKKLTSSEYRNFQSKFQIEGVWDDHDYGINNGGKNYKLKETSQELFLNFLNVPKNDERRNREGIYYTRSWTINGKTIKAYFLDCRFFKDRPYKSYSDILGENQWGWLEDELYSHSGDINIIVSPIGVLKNKLHFTEDWDDYRVAKRRLIDLLEKYDPPGLFFLSGDKHFGTFIEEQLPLSSGSSPFLEFQSSGLTHGLKRFLIRPIQALYGKHNMIPDRNFGKIEFTVREDSTRMLWKLYSLDNPNNIRIRQFTLDENKKWLKSEIMV